VARAIMREQREGVADRIRKGAVNRRKVPRARVGLAVQRLEHFVHVREFTRLILRGPTRGFTSYLQDNCPAAPVSQ